MFPVVGEEWESVWPSTVVVFFQPAGPPLFVLCGAGVVRVESPRVVPTAAVFRLVDVGADAVEFNC